MGVNYNVSTFKGIAFFILWIASALINLFANLYSKKDNNLAAMRAFTYASVIQIIPNIFPIVYLIPIIMIILETIGISKQYKENLGKSFLIAISPLILIYIMIFLFKMFIEIWI